MEETAEKKILIVEDDPLLLRVLREKFLDEGFLVFTATDGKAGVKVAFQEHPDLIILDILMPVVDGIEAYYEIRTNTWGVNVPVIFLTNTEPKHIAGKKYQVLIKSNTSIEDIITAAKKIFQPKKKK